MTDKPLIYTPGKPTLADRAREFREFKHKTEGAWEFIVFILIAAVFVLHDAAERNYHIDISACPCDSDAGLAF